jgi:dolichol-phosphate mannosyltransferase
VACPRLSVVVPTLNEGENIGPLLHRLEQHLSAVPHEIIVVDDDSTDGSRARVREAHPDVRLIHREHERGLGSAVKRGFEAARGEHVCVMDGDLQHPPEAVPDLLDQARWSQADVVVGSRYTPGGEVVDFPLGRRAVAGLARGLARVASPKVRNWGLRDPCSGFFVVRRDVLDLGALEPRGYKILLDVLHACPVEQVREVGIEFRSRPEGESKLSSGTAWAYLRQLAQIAAGQGPNRRLARFALVGLTGVVVNLALLAGLTEVAGLHYMASAAVAIETSILSNFVLNDVWTFRDRRFGRWWERLWRFNLVSLLALVVNLGVLSLLTEAAGLHYLASEVVAIGVGFLANYQGNLSWTYLPTTSRDVDPLPWTQ